MHRNRRVRFSHPSDLEDSALSYPITAERLTSDIRNCYDTVDKGRKLLGRLYDKLYQCDSEQWYQNSRKDYQLQIELDNLKDVLILISEKRGNYVKQLEKAQDIVWHDRREMEEFLQFNRATEKRLREKVEYLSKFSQRPESLVTELQKNSKVLGELLSDLKEQLTAEKHFIKSQTGDSNLEDEAVFSASPRDRWSYIRGRRRSKEDWGRDDDHFKYQYTPEWNYNYSLESSDLNRKELPSRDDYQVKMESSHNPEFIDERSSVLPETCSFSDVRKRYEQPSKGVKNDREERQDDCDTSSLSEKLRQLVKQSENVQKLISDSNRKVEMEKGNAVEKSIRKDSSQPLLPNEYFRKSAESGADKSSASDGLDKEKEDAGSGGKASDMPQSFELSAKPYLEDKDTALDQQERSDDSSIMRRSLENILQKCEDFERKMQSCSPRGVREKLLQNLDELDRADQTAERGLSPAASARQRGLSDRGCTRKEQVDHCRIRQEFVACLDKIFAMEKCYGSAGDEIRDLRRELEKALQERDAAEQSLRMEVSKLQERLQLKATDVDFYREKLKDVKKEHSDLKSKYDGEVASIEAERGKSKDEVSLLREECEQLKLKVDARSKEVDALRSDLENAIAEVRNLRESSPGFNYANNASTRAITSIEEVVSTFKGSKQESIAEELETLKGIIDAAEDNQRKGMQENRRLIDENALLSKENSELQKDTKELRSLVGKFEEGSNEQLMDRIDELELVLMAKDAELDHFSKRSFRLFEDHAEDLANVDLERKENELKQLRKKLSDYEELIAQEGGDMSRRLEEMYEECLLSVEKINKEKEVLEEDFQRQRLMYEDLLAECHNEISRLTNKERKFETIMSSVRPDKREILEDLITSVRSPKELAEILSRDVEDGPSRESLVQEKEKLQAENAKAKEEVGRIDREVAAYKREIDSMKKKNEEIKDKYEHLKSENYLLNKLRDDDGREKLKRYKEMLGKKEEECFRLRKILDESIDYEERDDLLGRLREVHRELLQDGDSKEELSLQSLQESLDKRDREIKRLKRQSRLLTEALGLDESTKRLVVEAILTNKDLDEYTTAVVPENEDQIRVVEKENRSLKRQISDLNGKMKSSGKLEEEVKMLLKKVKSSDEQCKTLDDDNFSLRERLKSVQKEMRELSTIPRTRKFSKEKFSDELLKENEQLSEDLMRKEIENERLRDKIDDFKEDLRRCEIEAKNLNGKLEAKSTKIGELESLKQENVEKDEILKDLSKKLGVVETERKRINEAYVKEKVKNEEEGKHTTEQIKRLQNEIAKATANGKTARSPVLSLNESHESLPFDERDGGISRYDRNRLIKKLQEENHQQSAKMLSLEEEMTAITKLVADMERGHGHLTGILRGHLVLQKEATAKLLEKSLQQYSDEFELCKKKFTSVEDRYDKNRKNLTRRRFAWDLFENATATVDNITAILVEGLIKVEDDLQDEFSSDEDFETRDYKSRIWLLRRRLDDVEKRYRDLMLRAEELSVRLDAKTTEYDVTQDELEDATRVLEMNEFTMARLRDELSTCLKENAKLKGILSQLKDNQERTVGNVIAENMQLKKEIDKATEDRTEVDGLQLEVKNLRDKLTLDNYEVREMRKRLREQEKREKEATDNLKEQLRREAREQEDETNRLQDDAKVSNKKIIESAMKINELERLLRKAEEKIASLEKYLQKARSGCRSDGIDHHGTIHMLRDDLKKLFKENEELKEELSSKQKSITALAKDLREAKVTVKEQLGTGRSLDEKILDRAAKDQIMALRRRIKVLEMENEKLVKKANNLERDQSFGDTAKRRKVSRTKVNFEGKGSESSCLIDEDSRRKEDDTVKSLSSGVFGKEERMDADNSLASVESFKDFSSENKEEIELRDSLIKELEGRVRELKQELARKREEEKTSSTNDSLQGIGDEAVKTVDDSSAAERDNQLLRKENAMLKKSLNNQKSLTVSHRIKQKDDVIKIQREKLSELEGEIDRRDGRLKLLQKELAEMTARLGNDWRRKEIVLIDSDAYGEVERHKDDEIEGLKQEIISLEAACETQKNTIVRLQEARTATQVGEEAIEASSEFSVEGVSEKFPESDSGLNDSSSKRVPKFISLHRPSKDEAASTTLADRSKSLSRIPVSPRVKQTVAQHRKADEIAEPSKDLEKKLEEQDEDIRTLLESVGYFEKEVEQMQAKVDENESLTGKLKNAEAEVKSLKAKSGKLQSQIKESKAHDEKLQFLEVKIEKLNTENRNLEQQMKKHRRSEDARTKSQSEASSRKIAALEKELKDKKKELDTVTMHLGLFKTQLEIKDLGSQDDVKKIKRAIRDSVERKAIKERGQNSSKSKEEIAQLESENMHLKIEVASTSRSVEEYLAEIGNLKGDLEEERSLQGKLHAELDESNDRFIHLKEKLDEVLARNAALEAVQDAVANSDVSSASGLGQESGRDDSNRLKVAWEDLKELLQDAFTMRELYSTLTGGSVEEIAEDIERASVLIENCSTKFADEMVEQQKANHALESRAEEFRKIVEDTNSRILELEEEVSEKEKGDEIGHKLLLDQIENLKMKIKSSENGKKDLEDEISRRENNIERLTGQVKFLERQVSQKDRDNSELTQRALDSEDELEEMRARIEELEDDYSRLLQHGMKLSEEDASEKEEEIVNKEELVETLKVAIVQLEEEKRKLEAKVEELTIANEELDKFDNFNAKEDELQQMEDTVYRLELDKADLQRQVDEFLANADESVEEKLEESARKIKSLEDAMFRLELEKASVQKAFYELKDGGGMEDVEMKKKVEKLEEDNAQLEEAVYQLDNERDGLRKIISELTSEETKGDVNDLTLRLVDNEERITDLEQEKVMLLAKEENLQRTLDDILQSPRGDGEDDEDGEENWEIFRGGPQFWKRRLIAAYRDLREKSTELAMMKMVVESKNVEVDLLSKEIKEGASYSEETSSLTEDERSGGRNTLKKLKATVFLLQEEVKMKSSEISGLRNEISSLQNELEVQESRTLDRPTVRINGKEENEVKNAELLEEVDKLKSVLYEKEDQYNALCDQLFGGEPIVTATENAQLRNEVEGLKEELASKDKSREDLEENYELIYNELTRMKAGVSSDGDSESALTGHEEKIRTLENALADYEEKHRLIAKDFDELEDKYREEMDYASTHIGQLMLQVSELQEQLGEVRWKGAQLPDAAGSGGETELATLGNRLKNTEYELERKKELITNLKETLANIYENTENQSGNTGLSYAILSCT